VVPAPELGLGLGQPLPGLGQFVRQHFLSDAVP
jgi:hypothetical protein